MADAKISALVAATTPLAGTEVVPVVQSSSTKKVSIADLTAGRTVAMRNADLTGGAAVINIGATADNSYHYVRTIDNDGQAFYFGNDNAAGSFFSAGAYGRVLYSEGAKPVKVFVNGAYRAEYDTSGNYKLDTGNLIIGTAGKGIDFSATPGTGTSELLADYEEGLHDALITCGTSGTVTMNTSRNAMAYTRIGRQVTITGMIEVASVLLPLGYFTISLPYAIATLSEFSARTTGTVIFPPITGSTKDFVVLTVEGESFIRVYKGSGSSYTSDAAQQLQASTQIHVNFTYFV